MAHSLLVVTSLFCVSRLDSPLGRPVNSRIQFLPLRARSRGVESSSYAHRVIQPSALMLIQLLECLHQDLAVTLRPFAYPPRSKEKLQIY